LPREGEQVGRHRRGQRLSEQAGVHEGGTLRRADLGDPCLEGADAVAELRAARPAEAAGSPAASRRSPASALVAHRTSCPAARNARASGYIGNMCPYPNVEENSTRTTAPSAGHGDAAVGLAQRSLHGSTVAQG
jgi:hypothetical protein